MKDRLSEIEARLEAATPGIMSKLTRKQVEKLMSVRFLATANQKDDIVEICSALLAAWDALEMLRYKGELNCIIDPPCGNCYRCNARNALPEDMRGE